jgi:RNA polymerase sigma-70 factor (ECF subfamily)
MSEPLPRFSDQALRAGSDAHTEFVQAHLRRIFLLIYRLVGNVDDAQDLTQETFIKALQRQGQLKDLAKSGQWLSRIASNTAIDFLRKHNRFQAVDMQELSERRSESDSPEGQLLWREFQLQLSDGLANLTDRERTALLLRDVEDMPADQVAAHMNCSMATVRSHIANARIKFRRYLEGRTTL